MADFYHVGPFGKQNTCSTCQLFCVSVSAYSLFISNEGISWFDLSDFSTLYTALPHNLIKDNLTELIEQTFYRDGSHYLACNEKLAFFTSKQP